MNDVVDDLDIERLARLGAFDDPAIAEIIQRFLDTLGQRFAGMESASACGDSRQVVRMAHQLHGSAANCGFEALAHACSGLHSSPGSFDLFTFQALAGSARFAWDRSRRC